MVRCDASTLIYTPSPDFWPGPVWLYKMVRTMQTALIGRRIRPSKQSLRIAELRVILGPMPSDAALDILLRESRGDLVIAAEAYRMKTGYSDAEWDLYKAAAASAEAEAKEAELAEQEFSGGYSDIEDDSADDVGTTEGRAASISCEFFANLPDKVLYTGMRTQPWTHPQSHHSAYLDSGRNAP